MVTRDKIMVQMQFIDSLDPRQTQPFPRSKPPTSAPPNVRLSKPKLESNPSARRLFESYPLNVSRLCLLFDPSILVDIFFLQAVSGIV